MPNHAVRVLIAAGGTGGHLYPASALAEKLEARGVEILFAGEGLTCNRFINRSNVCDIRSGPIPLKNPIKLLKNLRLMSQGVKEGRRMIREYAPRVVVGFGSYHTLPVLYAARREGVPIILHEQNSIPGRVNRFVSRYAVVSGTHFPEASVSLKGSTCGAAIPLRGQFAKGAVSREEATAYYELDSKGRTLLVFGGSQGAMAINRLFEKAASSLGGWQVIHITGNEDVQVLKERYAACSVNACVKRFESRMDLAWQAADLTVTRAGAGTLAEQEEFEVPAILIPYPYAMDRHQDKNADYMVKIGGALKFDQKELTPELLVSTMDNLLETGALLQMREAISRSKQAEERKGLEELVMRYLDG